ncbi:ferric-chelate reductase [Hypoxylon rubiginosum]|uniref:Ferric-chelate reductase n=1 Tax=Hypoxylon rubiginosum TaxID=110542 RepID=A0ACC0CIB7_9PEZI|nr:ferric-chelate reductase [Hypoxylon rubiginosum]
MIAQDQSEIGDLESSFEATFFVDQVLGVRRNGDGIELLLRWSTCEMTAPEIARWSRYRYKATPKHRGNGDNTCVVKWEPTWVTRDELGPGLQKEYKLWEQLLLQEEKKKRKDISQAGLRAGTLSLINLIFLYAGPHLSFLADVLGVSLYTFRRLHASAGGAALALAIFHCIVGAAERGGFSFATSQNAFAFTAIMTLCVQAVVFPVLLRVAPYELALRLHQGLAFLFLYALWCHIRFGKWFSVVYIYMAVGLFASVCLLQLGLLLYRNRLGLSPARISVDNRAIRVRVHLRRPVTVEAGQYINLWVSLWSCVQTHPFTVVSWSDTPQTSLDLFIEPRRGLTQDLLRLAAYGPTTSLAIWSGPHGKVLPVDRHENILLLATGFGIAAHLPYVKKLVYHHRARRTPVRRVHLVWQMDDFDIGIAAQPLLNEALVEDSLRQDSILRISIYLQSDDIQRAAFGSFGRRAAVFPGTLSLRDILEGEVAERRPGSRTVLVASVTGAVQDALKALMRDHLHDDLDLFFTEYQP